MTETNELIKEGAGPNLEASLIPFLQKTVANVIPEKKTREVPEASASEIDRHAEAAFSKPTSLAANPDL